MAIRILMLLLSLFIASALIIMLVSMICRVNLFEKHKKAIMNGYLGLVLLVVVIFVTLSILGLV